MLKIFGYSLIFVGRPQGPTVEQANALQQIPESIMTLEDQLNLGISPVPIAVCPKCSFTYEPSYSNGSPEPSYLEKCSNTTFDGTCDTDLLDSITSKPRKLFQYYPFNDWFGKFIAQPGIEGYGDAFCDHLLMNSENPATKLDSRDGRFVREFRANDGKLFVADRGDEGRWFFKFHVDSFNYEGNRIRGPSKSSGVLAMVCLNLPLHLSNDPANVYLAGLINGNPDTKEAAYTHYVRHITSDMQLAYARGITPYHSHNTHHIKKPYSRVHRVAVANGVMDLKAARPVAGLYDASAHHFCFICKCWHTAHLGRLDVNNFGAVDDNFLREGATLWANAKTKQERDRIEQIYGTRCSAMWILNYWRPSRQLVPETMHIFILRVLQNFYRHALGLDPQSSRSSYIAFFYDFTPPPHPSETASMGVEIPEDPSGRLAKLLTRSNHTVDPDNDDEGLLIVEWPDLGHSLNQFRHQRMVTMKQEIMNDKNAFRGVSRIHDLLSGPVSNHQKLEVSLTKMKWVALLYVCNDLMVFPSKGLERKTVIQLQDVTIKSMAKTLYSWVSELSTNKQMPI